MVSRMPQPGGGSGCSRVAGRREQSHCGITAHWKGGWTMPEPRPDETYIAALWEHPQLCVSLFGVQFHTPEGERLYAESGIQPEVESALAAASEEGLLLTRQLMSPEGPLLML